MASETPFKAQALVHTIRDVLHPWSSVCGSIRTCRHWRMAAWHCRSCGRLSANRPSSRAICVALPSLSRGVPRQPARFFRAVLDGEAAAMEAFEPLAMAVGMTPADRDAYEPTPEHRPTAPTWHGSVSMGVRLKSPQRCP